MSCNLLKLNALDCFRHLFNFFDFFMSSMVRNVKSTLSIRGKSSITKGGLYSAIPAAISVEPTPVGLRKRSLFWLT